MNVTHILCGAALLAAASAASAEETPNPAADPAPAFDREVWLADYAGLKRTMAQGYANLDWIVAHRGLDLPALDKSTTTRLEAAESVDEALAALKDFFAAFRDPHLAPRRGAAHPAALGNAAGKPQDPPGEGEQSDEPRSQDCTALGYRARAKQAAFDPAALPGWAPLASPYFTAGSSGRLGVIRIPSFDEIDYIAACEAAWQPGRIGCESQLATRAVLQSELARLAGALRSAGAEVLALDVTGNGGGSEWSAEAAALFAAGEVTRPSPLLVEPRCDRSGVWRGEAVCSNFAAQAGADRLAGQGAWQGPAVVLVDRRSASAAEDFAYWLAGSGVARIVGERTFGAGCGYVDGGWAYQLTAFDAHVMIPNCSRYTADGINQIEGLVPDVAYDWSNGAEGLAAELDRLAG